MPFRKTLRERDGELLSGFTLSLLLHILLIATLAYGKPSSVSPPRQEEVIKVSFVELPQPEPEQAEVYHPPPPPVKPEVIQKPAPALKKKKQVRKRKQRKRKIIVKKRQKEEPHILPVSHPKLKNVSSPPVVRRAVSVSERFTRLNLARISSLIQKGIVYPVIARKLRWKGRVVCRFQLSPDGDVSRIELLESSSHPVLDKAVLHAIEGLSRAGSFPHPEEAVSLTVPVRFSFK